MRPHRTWTGAALLLAALGCQQASPPVVPSPVAITGAATLNQPKPAWLAFGDSITQDAFGSPQAWRAVLGADGPLQINAGVRGDTTTTALGRLARVLDDHPQARYVGLAFGTNDVWGRMPLAQFKAQLQAMIDQVRAANKVPVLATIPYSPESELSRLPEYNRAIRELEAANGLNDGPDLYSLVQDNEGYLSPDGVHMTPEGSQAIQRAWAEVASRQPW